MKKSPLQKVRDEFGSKEELAKRLLPLLERPEGESQEAFARRLGAASNLKLLRLWRAEHAVKERFGSKEKLVDALVTAKFGKDNADYRASLNGLTKTRLLDLHRQIAR